MPVVIIGIVATIRTGPLEMLNTVTDV